MRAYQNFTSVCGVLQLTTPRDAFLTSLCKNCLPTLPALDQRSLSNPGNTAAQETSTPNITEKNMYCLRILLNVAQYLGGTLFDSWYLILETMQQAEHLLTAKLHRGSASQTGQLAKKQGVGSQQNKTMSPTQNTLTRSNTSQLSNTIDYSSLASGSSHQEADVLALLASFKQLFDLSTHLDLSSFQSFTRALCKLGAAGSGLPIADGKGSTAAPFLKGLRHVNVSQHAFIRWTGQQTQYLAGCLTSHSRTIRNPMISRSPSRSSVMSACRTWTAPLSRRMRSLSGTFQWAF